MGDPMPENKPGKAHLKIIISTAVLLGAIVLTVQYISLARQTQRLKTDLAEINHIRYGLLNVDEWTDQISTIPEHQNPSIQVNSGKQGKGDP